MERALETLVHGGVSLRKGVTDFGDFQNDDIACSTHRNEGVIPVGPLVQSPASAMTTALSQPHLPLNDCGFCLSTACAHRHLPRLSGLEITLV